jgi:PAS domain S-box-containing protein
MSLPLHIAAETFAIVIAILVFAIAWNSYDVDRSSNMLILACGFLAVGLMDFGHMLSVKGMPDFVTPSGPEKGIQFWLCGRFVTAAILLAAALNVWKPLADISQRYWMLFASLLLTGLVYWLVLFYGDVWPRTFIEGSGLTPFKIGAEYLIIAILSVSAILYYREFANGNPNPSADSVLIYVACVILLLSEFCFVLYSSVADIFNALGHFFNIVAYYFIYRAIFIHSVREPYNKLSKTKNELSASQRMLESIIASIPIRIFWKDRHSRFLGANNLLLKDAGVTDMQQLIGKDDFAFFPQEQAARFQADDKSVMDAGLPKLNIEEPILTADGKQAWLLTNKVPMLDENNQVTGILGAYLDITHLRKVERDLEESHSVLRELVVHREAVLEAERQRIAQDLHDDLGQMLTVLRLDLSLLQIQHGENNPALTDQIKQIKNRIDLTIQVIRDVSSRLRPAVLNMNLISVLEKQTEEFSTCTGTPCSLNISCDEASINEAQTTAIYRIVQECFTNIIRHARATQVELSLFQKNSSLYLEIHDNGIGFEMNSNYKNTFGLIGMRERVLVLEGDFKISSAPGHGTWLSVRLPLVKAKEAA